MFNDWAAAVCTHIRNIYSKDDSKYFMIKRKFWILKRFSSAILPSHCHGNFGLAIGWRGVQEDTCTSILIIYGLLYFHTEYHYSSLVSLK